jgi:hypothetical protein
MMIDELLAEIKYRRGVRVNLSISEHAPKWWLWHLYIGGVCVGELEATVKGMQERLAEIRDEARRVMEAASDAGEAAA